MAAIIPAAVAERRLGRFGLAKGEFESAYTPVRPLLADAIIIRRRAVGPAGEREYTAYHPAFDALPEGMPPPRYVLAYFAEEGGSMTACWRRASD